MRSVPLIGLLLLSTTQAFAEGGVASGPGSTSDNGLPQTDFSIENCVRLPDPMARSGCTLDVSVKEKTLVYCEMIEFPDMVIQCIDKVGQATKLTASDCQSLNAIHKEYCLKKVNQAEK